MPDTSLTLTVSSFTVTVNEPVTISARLIDTSLNVGVNNRNILFYVRQAGDLVWYNIDNAITTTVSNALGVAQIQYAFPSTGNWELLARWLGDTSYTTSDSAAVPVVVVSAPPPIISGLSWPWIIVGVAVAGGALYAVWHFTRKRRPAPTRMG